MASVKKRSLKKKSINKKTGGRASADKKMSVKKSAVTKSAVTMSFDAFVQKANKKYGLKLPRQKLFPDGSLLHELWGQQIEVVEHPDGDTEILVQAKAKTGVTIFASVLGKIMLQVKQAATVANNT